MRIAIRHALGLLAALAVSAPSAPARQEPPAARVHPRLGSVEAELARAVQHKRRAQNLRGPARTAALEAAIDAYRAVGEHWPEERASTAEAAFRTGELLRRLERDGEAALAFARARELGAGTPFRARAGIELGHVARRADDLEGARLEFTAVARDELAERRYRDDAALWAARMDADLGRVELARRAFEALAAGAESALDRVDAFDEWCESFVDAGDLEAAAGVLALCREALHAVAEEETPLGERVRNSLTRMRSVRRLEEAVRARQKGVIVEKRAER